MAWTKNIFLFLAFFKKEETCVTIDDITALEAFEDLKEAKARGVTLSLMVKSIGF